MVSAIVRQAEPRDVEAIHGLQFIAYPEMSKVAAWGKQHLESHQSAFPQGQLVAVVDDQVVGHSANLIVRSQIALAPHKYSVITGRGTFSTHDPHGDTLYGAEIMVHPELRRQGIGRQFYERRFELARQLGLRYFLSGGRLPGYAEHRDITVEEYVAGVLRGDYTDRTLSAQLAVGLGVRGVLPDYINDPKSSNSAALLAWQNPDKSDPTAAPICPSPQDLSAPALAQALRLGPSIPTVTAW